MLNQKKLDTKMLDELKTISELKNVTVGDALTKSNVAVGANANTEVSFTVTKPTGYTLVGALIQSNGNSYSPILSMRAVDNASSTVSIMAYNLGSSAITRTISIRPVFQK